MHRQQGFTLLEVMIVVAIVGILAMIAVPSYTEYLTRGKIQEASSQLSDLRVKMEQYYMDNRKYNAAAGVCGAAMPAPPLVKYFAYTCVSTNPKGANDQSYTITATGCSATGTPATCAAGQGMGGFVFTIDQGNTKQTTGVGAGWSAAGLPLNCWVQKKGDTC